MQSTKIPYPYTYIPLCVGGSKGTAGQYILCILPSAEGNIRYIAHCGEQYLDIAWEGGFQQSFEPLFDTKIS